MEVLTLGSLFDQNDICLLQRRWHRSHLAWNNLLEIPLAINLSLWHIYNFFFFFMLKTRAHDLGFMCLETWASCAWRLFAWPAQEN